MKKIYITREQLNYLNEENSVNISAMAKNNTLSDFSNIATNTNTVSDINKASRVGDVHLTITGPQKDDSQPTQMVNVAPGDSIQNAIKTQANDDLIRAGSSVQVTGDGLNEFKIFTKKMVEEARTNGLKSKYLK